MPARASRRDLLLGGIAASLTIPSIVNADAPKPELSHADELLANALKANQDNATQRQKHALAENSEPCFTYIPEPRQVRKR